MTMPNSDCTIIPHGGGPAMRGMVTEYSIDRESPYGLTSCELRVIVTGEEDMAVMPYIQYHFQDGVATLVEGKSEMTKSYYQGSVVQVDDKGAVVKELVKPSLFDAADDKEAIVKLTRLLPSDAPATGVKFLADKQSVLASA